MVRTTLHPSDTDAARLLVLDIQAMQSRAHRLGLPITARALNNAMNASGWEQAGDFLQAAKAAVADRGE